MPGLRGPVRQAANLFIPLRQGMRVFPSDPSVRRFFPRCGYPACASGPIRLWRSRQAPVFEGRWACSPECLRAMVEAAIRREGHGRENQWSPRVPLRLMLLEQGEISEDELRKDGRKRLEGAGREGLRLEEWLPESGVLGEAALTRAISAQWNCPVFSLSPIRAEEMAAALPLFLAEALGAVPVRVTAGELLYLAFSERIDRSLAYAVEHITGLRVAAGIARSSEFSREQARFLSARAPGTRILEADDRSALAQRMSAWMEEERPMEARLARIHELWWLRIWRKAPGKPALPAFGTVEDLLATVGGPMERAKTVEEIAVPPIREMEGGGASCRE